MTYDRGMQWWPRRSSVAVTKRDGTDTGQRLIMHQYAWWQWRNRRRMRDVRNLERFRWRSVRFGFRRPADHWKNDPPISN
jgi:hypothetical protein